MLIVLKKIDPNIYQGLQYSSEVILVSIVPSVYQQVLIISIVMTDNEI